MGGKVLRRAGRQITEDPRQAVLLRSGRTWQFDAGHLARSDATEYASHVSLAGAVRGVP